jgi:hypothetical protein
MKTFSQFLSEAPFVPKPPSTGEGGLGVVGGDLLGSPQTNSINVPQSKASSGSMGFNIDPFTANKLNNELLSTGRNPENYNSTYSATTDLKSDENNQQNQSVQFRMLQAMFDQLPPDSGINGTIANDMANALSVNGFKVDEVYEAMIKMYQEYSKGQGLNISPYQAINNLIAAKQQTDKGLKPQTKPNVNVFDPLADLKKHKLFAPVEYNEVMGDEVGESGFDGTDAIYGS